MYNFGVVLLQHGLMGSACDFLYNTVNGSLGFVLADAGYDVWLSNSRGNTYSTTNKKYSPSQDKFWDWSWQEEGEYDLPAVINYILNITKQEKLFYIGHSQGTLMANAEFSENKDLADKVKLYIEMAPIAKVAHIRGFVGYIGHIFNPDILYVVLGKKDFGQNSSTTQWYADRFCTTLPREYVCNGLSSLVAGYDINNLNISRLPVYLSHGSQGTSVRNIVHYAQSIKSDKFQKYDYGASQNLKHYNQSTPPEYDIKNLTIPVALFSGGQDFLADPTDVQYLVDNLPNIVYRREYPQWNHNDFVLGKDASTTMYTDILKLLKKFA